LFRGVAGAVNVAGVALNVSGVAFNVVGAVNVTGVAVTVAGGAVNVAGVSVNVADAVNDAGGAVDVAGAVNVVSAIRSGKGGSPNWSAEYSQVGNQRQDRREVQEGSASQVERTSNIGRASQLGTQVGVGPQGGRPGNIGDRDMPRANGCSMLVLDDEYQPTLLGQLGVLCRQASVPTIVSLPEWCGSVPGCQRFPSSFCMSDGFF
jgi:hypothetical protein